MRFAIGAGVAADDAAGTCVETHGVHQRVGQPSGFVGDDAPGDVVVFDVRQYRFHSGEQLRADTQIVGIVIEEKPTSLFETRCIRLDTEAQADQRDAAVRYDRPDGLVRQRVATVVLQRGVERRGEIRRGVDEGAVEIEQHGLRVVDVGHSARSVQTM